MGEFLGVIGVISMLSSVAMSGVDAGRSADGLRDSINKMDAKIAKYQQGYQALLYSQEVLKQELIDEMNQDIADITQFALQIDQAKKDHAVAYRSIQIAGITMVIFITFIFLLKIFGFYEIFIDVLGYPFRTIYNKIRGDKSVITSEK